VLNALDRLASGYVAECHRVERDLNLARSQLRDYQGNLDKLFPHERYLAELTDLRDRLKAGLSGNPKEEATKQRPSVTELAEQIKALLAANTVDVTPERIGHRQSIAEEPITARIRRRTETNPASDRVPESDAEPEAEGVHLGVLTQNLALDPRRTFQERIMLERKRKDDGPSPP
jgi:hypothetical protein